MIFVGCNIEVSLARYGDHHSRWTDSRCLPIFVRRWWRNLKDRQPAWRVLEWIVAYRKQYCKRCTQMFIEDERFYYYNGIKDPTKEDRINVVSRLTGRFK